MNMRRNDFDGMIIFLTFATAYRARPGMLTTNMYNFNYKGMFRR